MVAAWIIFQENKLFGAGSKGFRYECYNSKKLINDKNVSCSTHHITH